MTEAEIQQHVFEALRKVAPEADPHQLRPDDNLRETLDIDSFDFLNFLIGLRERTGIEIPEADYGRIASLNQLLAYLLRRS
jgi:acyl carrier protein